MKFQGPESLRVSAIIRPRSSLTLREPLFAARNAEAVFYASHHCHVAMPHAVHVGTEAEPLPTKSRVRKPLQTSAH